MSASSPESACSEIGSFFDWPELSSHPTVHLAWIGATLVNSGRAALKLVVDDLVDHGYGTLWVPSYHCPDFVDYVRNSIRVREYPCDPAHQRLPESLAASEACLVTSYFGQCPPDAAFSAQALVLDTTHDPLADWIAHYPHKYRVSSLRKTLPLPEGAAVHGAALKSPGTPGPTRPDLVRVRDAMQAKAAYLRGVPTDKAAWLSTLRTWEQTLEAAPPAALTPEVAAFLSRMPVNEWRQTRLANLATVKAALTAQVMTLESTFGLILVLESIEEADSLFGHLIEQQIFPARLWFLDEEASAMCEGLDRRLLMVHTDHRYGEADMHRVAATVNAWR